MTDTEKLDLILENQEEIENKVISLKELEELFKVINYLNPSQVRIFLSFFKSYRLMALQIFISSEIQDRITIDE